MVRQTAFGPGGHPSLLDGYNDCLLSIVDPSMQQPFPDAVAETFLELAVACVSRAAEERPPLTEVVSTLHELLNYRRDEREEREERGEGEQQEREAGKVKVEVEVEAKREEDEDEDEDDEEDGREQNQTTEPASRDRWRAAQKGNDGKLLGSMVQAAKRAQYQAWRESLQQDAPSGRAQPPAPPAKSQSQGAGAAAAAAAAAVAGRSGLVDKAAAVAVVDAVGAAVSAAMAAADAGAAAAVAVGEEPPPPAPAPTPAPDACAWGDGAGGAMTAPAVREERESRAVDDCVVCMDSPRGCRLRPCCHFIMCYDCAFQVRVSL